MGVNHGVYILSILIGHNMHGPLGRRNSVSFQYMTVQVHNHYIFRLNFKKVNSRRGNGNSSACSIKDTQVSARTFGQSRLYKLPSVLYQKLPFFLHIHIFVLLRFPFLNRFLSLQKLWSNLSLIARESYQKRMLSEAKYSCYIMDCFGAVKNKNFFML